MMNEYARFAELAWQTLAPTRYKALQDPNQFFSTMGEEAAQQVLNLTLALEGNDLDGETYLEKVGRLTSARMQAQEIVRQRSNCTMRTGAIESAEGLLRLVEQIVEPQR